MKKLIIAAMCTGLLSGGAYAEQRTNTATAADEVDSTTEIICRRMPPPAGSRIGARNVCRTRAQWDEYDQESREFMERMFNRSKTQGNEG